MTSELISMVIVGQLKVWLERDDERRQLMVVALIGTISMQNRNYFNVAEAFKNITVKKGREQKESQMRLVSLFHR
jgi:endonuclease III-like uncharacterized protein